MFSAALPKIAIMKSAHGPADHFLLLTACEATEAITTPARRILFSRPSGTLKLACRSNALRRSQPDRRRLRSATRRTIPVVEMYGILIYDGVEPIDLGATFGVLSIAKRIAPDLSFAGVARSAGAVTCANGMKVVADHGFADAPVFEDLIVTGGPGWTDAAADDATLSYLRATKSRVSSICTGAMIIAAAGLLDGKRATTKHAVFAGETPPVDLLGRGIATEHAAIVDDGGIVTGGGITLGIDTMFYCLARSHGEEVAKETARVMEYGRALAANKDALGYA